MSRIWDKEVASVRVVSSKPVAAETVKEARIVIMKASAEDLQRRRKRRPPLAGYIFEPS
jgi:hypothetical protein